MDYQELASLEPALHDLLADAERTLIVHHRDPWWVRTLVFDRQFRPRIRKLVGPGRRPRKYQPSKREETLRRVRSHDTVDHHISAVLRVETGGSGSDG